MYALQRSGYWYTGSTKDLRKRLANNENISHIPKGFSRYCIWLRFVGETRTTYPICSTISPTEAYRVLKYAYRTESFRHEAGYSIYHALQNLWRATPGKKINWKDWVSALWSIIRSISFINMTPIYKPTLGGFFAKHRENPWTHTYEPQRARRSLDRCLISEAEPRQSLRFRRGQDLQVADVVRRNGTDFILNIETEKVPLPNGSQNTVLMFNILEHLFEHGRVLEEIRRLLAPKGLFIGTIPFLVNVHPDPHDFVRFTKEALERLFTKHGFTVRVIEPIGRGPFLAAYEQLDMLVWSPLQLVFLPIVWCLDGLIQGIKPNRNFKAEFPLAYNFIVEKS